MSERTFLEEINIKNIGVITQATVEFNKGLTVLTGETGAGKNHGFNSTKFSFRRKKRKFLSSQWRGEIDCQRFIQHSKEESFQRLRRLVLRLKMGLYLFLAALQEMGKARLWLAE